MDEYFERQKQRRFPRLELDEECLRWTPLVSSAMLDEEERRAEIQVYCLMIYLTYTTPCKGKDLLSQ